ncbi:MAG TPA: gliding motility protein RemB, partial [Pedobacter sp.]
YTYSQRRSLLSYGHYNQPLAHPFGANFREVLGIADYSYHRFQFFLQGNFAKYGLDPAGKNFGKDIFQSYETRVGNFGNTTGQGNTTNFMYVDGRTSFLLNPKTNLRIELGAVLRTEKNSSKNDQTTWLTFGLRSSFRNLYQDF